MRVLLGVIAGALENAEDAALFIENMNGWTAGAGFVTSTTRIMSGSLWKVNVKNAARFADKKDYWNTPGRAVNACFAERRVMKGINGSEKKVYVFKLARYAVKGRQYLTAISQSLECAGRNAVCAETSAAWITFSKVGLVRAA